MEAPARGQKKQTLLLALVLALAAALPYMGAVNGPLIFDDRVNVLDNPSIQSLRPPWKALWAPPGKGMAGRPTVNFSLAVNYALSGFQPRSYHLANFAAHAMAALFFFGFVRRLLGKAPSGEAVQKNALWLGFAAALLWAVHPLHTSAVAYVSQRCVVFMGMFYLLTLYLAVRGWESDRPLAWHAGAVFAFLLGVGSKEIIVGAPLALLALDWVFYGRRPLPALKKSPLLYGGLALCWIPLALLVASGKSASATPLDAEMRSLEYLLIQPEVIFHYLRLFFWPASLCFDYTGWQSSGLGLSLALGAVILAGAGAAFYGLYKRRWWGFWGLFFFLTLGPTSSFLPLKDAAYEYRMYLPGSALVVLFVAGGFSLVSRIRGKAKLPGRALVFWVAVCLCLSAGLAGRTFVRGLDFRSKIAIWTHTVEQRPDNPRGHVNLAQAYKDTGQNRLAEYHYLRTLDLRPDYPKAHFNLANLYQEAGNPAKAVHHYRVALEQRPSLAIAHINLGSVLAKTGEVDLAIHHYRRALAHEPQRVEAHYNLANALAHSQQWQEAAFHYMQAARLRPDLVQARQRYAWAVANWEKQKVQAGKE